MKKIIALLVAIAAFFGVMGDANACYAISPLKTPNKSPQQKQLQDDIRGELIASNIIDNDVK